MSRQALAMSSLATRFAATLSLGLDDLRSEEDDMSQLSSDDRAAIGEVLARYCHAIDFGRWDDLRELFTADGRLDMAPMGVFEGRDGIRKFTDQMQAAGIVMRHFVTNLVVQGDGDRARVESYVLAISGQPGNTRQTTGQYEDDLVKETGRWLIRSRRVKLDLPKT
jgi:ketosteroid isomerase-like protein